MTDAQNQSNPHDSESDPIELAKDAEAIPDPTDALDHVKCRVQGIKVQADINAQNEQALADAQTKFARARLEYISTHDQNDDTIKQLGDQVTRLVARIRSKFTDSAIPERLDKAYNEVAKKIDAYKPKPPPGPTAASTDDGTKELEALRDPAELRRVRTIMQRLKDEMDTALQRFELKSNEPGALSERIAKCKDDIATAEKGSESKDEAQLAESFAQALVAQRHQKSLASDFDTSKQFISTLASELENLTKVANDLGIAAGVEARLACLESAASARYRELQDTMVAEVVATYQLLGDTTTRSSKEQGPAPQVTG